jgi:hypothetical protein
MRSANYRQFTNGTVRKWRVHTHLSISFMDSAMEIHEQWLKNISIGFPVVNTIAAQFCCSVHQQVQETWLYNTWCPECGKCVQTKLYMKIIKNCMSGTAVGRRGSLGNSLLGSKSYESLCLNNFNVYRLKKKSKHCAKFLHPKWGCLKNWSGN